MAISRRYFSFLYQEDVKNTIKKQENKQRVNKPMSLRPDISSLSRHDDSCQSQFDYSGFSSGDCSSSDSSFSCDSGSSCPCD